MDREKFRREPIAVKHLNDIATLIRTLQLSASFHALVVESPPGWAKSSTIDRVLHELDVSFLTLGSYSTPLYFYNSLCESPSALLVLDDSAGLLGDPIGMAILKAATWPSAGSGGDRRVTWHSTSERVAKPSVVFSGKLILLTNHISKGADAEAFLSRALYLSLNFGRVEIKQMLRAAALDREHFEDTDLATRVAEALSEALDHGESSQISLRTLKMGYEVAKASPATWREVLASLVPHTSVDHLVRSLTRSAKGTDKQAREFTRATGLSRRTFYYHRKALRNEQCNLHSSGPQTALIASPAAPVGPMGGPSDCSQSSDSATPAPCALPPTPSLGLEGTR